MKPPRPDRPLERAGGWKRLVQTPAMIAILNDDLTHRVIHMDGRVLEADPIPSWAVWGSATGSSSATTAKPRP